MPCELLDSGEQGNKESITGRWLRWLKCNIYMSEIPRQNLFELSIYT
jgi:hypothetical protein